MAIDLDALRAKHAELEKSGGGNADFVNNFLQLKEGTTAIRILPGKDEDTLFYAETAIHRVPDGVDDSGKPRIKNYHCRKVQGEACPLCDAYYAAWKPPYEDEDLGRQIKARSRYYMNVLDRESGEVKILSVGVILFKKLINTMLDEDYGDITNPQTGHDFKIVKTIEGQWPKYDQSAPRPKSSPLGTKKEVAEFMDSLHDIHALVKLEEYDELKKVAQVLLPDPSADLPPGDDVGDDEYLEKMSK